VSHRPPQCPHLAEQDAVNPWVWLFYVALMIFCSLFLLNLMLAVLYIQFTKAEAAAPVQASGSPAAAAAAAAARKAVQGDDYDDWGEDSPRCRCVADHRLGQTRVALHTGVAQVCWQSNGGGGAMQSLLCTPGLGWTVVMLLLVHCLELAREARPKLRRLPSVNTV